MQSIKVCVLGAGVSTLLAWSSGALAANRYVDPSGVNIPNACLNPANPCATVAYAVSISAPGDVINLRGSLSANNIPVGHDLDFVGDPNVPAELDASWSSRHFRINNGANVTFRQLSMVNGMQSANGRGGAIWVRSGTLSTFDVSFYDNEAYDGGAIACTDECTGLNLQRTSFRENFATSGGAVFSLAGVTIQGCSFDSNLATDGGAIFHDGSDLLVRNSDFTSNDSAGRGGAIFSHDETGDFLLDLRKSYFGGNIAGDAGGALYLHDADADLTSLAEVTNTTFDGNSALLGGAVASEGAALTISLTNVTMVSNDGGVADHISPSGTFELRDSILTGASEECSSSIGGGNNLTDAESCGPRVAAVTGLGTLGRHGGDTRNFELTAGSNALGAVPTCALAVDQRNRSRPAVCDIGAYERP